MGSDCRQSGDRRACFFTAGRRARRASGFSAPSAGWIDSKKTGSWKHCWSLVPLFVQSMMVLSEHRRGEVPRIGTRRIGALRTGLWVIVTGIVLYLLARWWYSCTTSRRLESTYFTLIGSPFVCPEGTREHVERWGKVGFARSCRCGNTKHGPWQAWEGGRLLIEGHYREGRRDGIWTWYGADGSVDKSVSYQDEPLRSRQHDLPDS